MSVRCYEQTGMKQRFFDKGTLSNLISFVLMLVGLATSELGRFSSWILAAGLFGFAGGITNWLAVKMLFDRVPLLYGSGVIPNRFREIRQSIKDLIMAHFFSEDYLQRFLAEHAAWLPGAEEVEARLLALLESEAVDRAIQDRLEGILHSPRGMLIRLAGIDTLKNLARRLMQELAADLSPRLVEHLLEPVLNVHALRGQLDRLLAVKLEELKPETVKRMMEEVIRHHLGWLIVWGNVFGGAIGLIAKAAGY